MENCFTRQVLRKTHFPLNISYRIPHFVSRKGIKIHEPGGNTFASLIESESHQNPSLFVETLRSI